MDLWLTKHIISIRFLYPWRVQGRLGIRWRLEQQVAIELQTIGQT